MLSPLSKEGAPKGGRIVKKKVFDLNLRIAKDKNRDYYREISIDYFKTLPAAANNINSMDMYVFTLIFSYKQPPYKKLALEASKHTYMKRL